MNRREIRDYAGFILGFNDAQTEGDFTAARLNNAINWAYEQRWNETKQQVARKSLVEYTDETWPSGDTSFELPAYLRGKALYKFVQVSSDVEMELSVSFKTRNVLQWDASGPTGDITLRCYYIASAEKLETDDQVPALIPPAHHQIISWDAAILLKTIADQEVPSSWSEMQSNLSMSLVKDMDSRPLADYARISPLLSDDGWLIGVA